MQQNLKVLVRGAYDIQKLRVMTGNRIAGNFRSKIGQKPSETLTDKEAKNILEDIKKSYRLLTDGIVGNLPKKKKFKAEGVIDSYTELVLVNQYMKLREQEDSLFRQLHSVLCDYPIYTDFLDKIKGVGPAMAGIIMSEFDIHKAKYPSSLWAYAGLDVARDGKGRSRKKEHLEEREYVDKHGEVKQKKGITYNPFLKTKLIGVLGTSFLRSKSPYADIYYDYRNRLENHKLYGKKNDDVRKEQFKKEGQKYSPDLHRHNMSIRYCVKQFLVDLYVVWRKLEGLPVAATYAEAKLGLKHNSTDRAAA